MVRLPTSPRARHGRLAGILCVLLAAQAAPLSGVGSGLGLGEGVARAQDAKSHLSAGDKAARAKDWATALTEYQAANAAQPSAAALEGVANAHYQLKHDADAYAAYDEYVKKYGASAPRAKKTLADARLKELGAKVGSVTIDVSESGATVTVDDKPAGTTPLAGPLRLASGPHRIRVTKDGFVPFDQSPNVSGGAAATVHVKLQALADKGRITVKEKSGQHIRVTVDGVDMGDAPWFGDVAAGDHEVAGHGDAVVAPAQKVHVDRGKTVDVELVARSSTAPVRIVTSDGKGTITLDGKVVGEGTFTGDVGAGPHTVKIVREGYDPFEEKIDVKEKEPLARTVTLKLSSKIETGAVAVEGRRLAGIYGGFGVLGAFLPGGMKSSMQKLCSGAHPAELASCDEGNGLGASLNGFLGYHWDPIGVELFLGAQYDNASPTLVWGPSSTDPGLGPDPARTEEFSLHRFGGFGALRIRLTLQTSKIRFTAATGVGLSYVTMFMKRDTKAAADPNQRDVFAPDAQGYLSPVLSFDPAIHYLLSPTTSVGLGLSLLIESPRAFDQTPTTTRDPARRLGPSGLSTPSYTLASDTQIYFGPFIGMMFGP
jgi:hypothetical protein